MRGSCRGGWDFKSLYIGHLHIINPVDKTKLSLYLFGHAEELNFCQEKHINFEKWCLWQPCIGTIIKIIIIIIINNNNNNNFF